MELTVTVDGIALRQREDDLSPVGSYCLELIGEDNQEIDIRIIPRSVGAAERIESMLRASLGMLVEPECKELPF